MRFGHHYFGSYEFYKIQDGDAQLKNVMPEKMRLQGHHDPTGNHWTKETNDLIWHVKES